MLQAAIALSLGSNSRLGAASQAETDKVGLLIVG